MSEGRKKVGVPNVDLSISGMKVFAEALTTFTTQITLHNSLLSSIMDNTDDNPEIKNILNDIKTSSNKIVNYIESNDGLTKLVQEKTVDFKSDLKDASNYIILRVIIAILGLGVMINTIAFWVEKSAVTSNIEAVVKEVLKHIK